MSQCGWCAVVRQHSRTAIRWRGCGGAAAGYPVKPASLPATNSAQGPWWILGWSERVPGAEDVLPAPLPPYRELTGWRTASGGR
ncbi:hypothetical protein ECZU28_06430 [Escherichia coli]|nr:hypothetical protein ECZU28_06430 [Escherichia coli]